MWALMNDPLAETKALDLSGAKEIVKNADGTVSFLAFNDHYVTQVENQKGKFTNDASSVGLFERFGMQGNLVTSWNRPPAGLIFTYVLVQLPNA